MGSVVSLARTDNPKGGIKDSVGKAIDLIDFNMPSSTRTVIIKANLCYYWDAATGHTTDPTLVAAIIDYIRERCGADIEIKVAEADATAMQTRHAFVMLGYEKLAKEKRIELSNLCNDTLVEKDVQLSGRTIKFKIPKSLTTCDLYINVPKFKIQSNTVITCSLKNVFGCIASQRKIAYHPFLNEAIVGINKILRPHLTIVDGLIALGRFPVKLNLVMASTDPFSIDWIVSQIAGYNPHRVGFLREALKEKLGEPDGITTRGENIDTFKKIFPRKNLVYSDFLLKIQRMLLKSYVKIAGDVVPPSLEGL